MEKEELEKEREDFVKGRYKTIKDEKPDDLGGSPKFVLHIIPENNEIILNREQLAAAGRLLIPILSAADNPKIPKIEDDYVLVASYASYAKMYKNGAVEIVRGTYTLSDIRTIPVEYERHVNEAYKAALRAFTEIGIELPLFGRFAILGAEGAYIEEKRKYSPTVSPVPLRIEDLIFHEFQIDSYDRIELEADPFLFVNFDNILSLVGMKRVDD